VVAQSHQRLYGEGSSYDTLLVETGFQVDSISVWCEGRGLRRRRKRRRGAVRVVRQVWELAFVGRSTCRFALARRRSQAV
jgi:hypothetical protein